MQTVKVTDLDRDSSVALLPSRRIVETASETTQFDGDVSSLELVLVLSASALRGSGSVAFTVETSADGSTWSTVHSASVSTADEDVATIDAAAYVRVTASLGSLRSAVVSALGIVRSAASSGGGSQPLTLLGPYTVNYNAPGLETDGVAIATLDAGTIVLQAWVHIATVWDIGVTFNVAVGGDDYLPPDNGWENVCLVDADASAGSPSGTRLFSRRVGTPPAGAVLVTDGALVASIGGGSGAAQGQALVYALVYIPA